jgi:hypothetical protein
VETGVNHPPLKAAAFGKAFRRRFTRPLREKEKLQIGSRLTPGRFLYAGL